MSLTRCFAICLGCALAASVAGAHQGGDFIALEDYAIGHQGEGSLGTGYDVESYSGGDEISSTQSFFISPLPRIGVGVDVRFGEDANGDWVYSSVSPRLQVQLTDPHKDTRFKIGLSVGYQFAEDISVQDTVTTFEEITVYRDAPLVTATETTTTVIDTGEEETTCNPLFDLDCEPKSAKSKKTTKHSGHRTTTTTTSGGGGGESQREQHAFDSDKAVPRLGCDLLR